MRALVASRLWGNLWSFGVGQKFVMAATGAGLVLFVVLHMLGNLQMLLGPDVFNTYSALLQGSPVFLWTLRAVLLVGVVLHVLTATRLSARNFQARPTRYRVTSTRASGAAARFMRSTGALLLAFILFHLQHFTVGSVQPAAFVLQDALGRHDAYSMMVLGLAHPVWGPVYAVATLLLMVHLRHAVLGMARTLGWDHPGWARAAWVVSLGVGAGNLTLVTAAQLGLVVPAALP